MCILQLNHGVKQDNSEAKKYYEKAAEPGHGETFLYNDLNTKNNKLIYKKIYIILKFCFK